MGCEENVKASSNSEESGIAAKISPCFSWSAGWIEEIQLLQP